MTAERGESGDQERAMALGLTILDELVAPALAWAAPLRFDIARTPAERQAVYRLRYQAVMERGWADPAELPDGLEHDAFDEAAVHILGWAEDRPVATNRLVFPRPGRLSPTETIFGLTIEPRGHIVEWTRTVVARGISEGTHRALAGLFFRSWQATREQGYAAVCGNSSAQAIRLYRQLGIQIEVVGEAQRSWGEERYPIRLHVARSAPAVAAWLARVSARI